MRTVKFFTLGCKVNQYDTQLLREQFLKCGFRESSTNKSADFCVINTCTVTSSADKKSRYLINSARRHNPRAKIIVTGCLAELEFDRLNDLSEGLHIIRNRDKGRLVYLLGLLNDLSANTNSITDFSDHSRAFLKIQDGCNNFCSYCRVPLARGRSRSRDFNSVVQEATVLAHNGFKEVVLTGICLGDFGRDLFPKRSLPDLIMALEQIPELLRIRLSSIEARDVSDELIGTLAVSDKLCPHLHIPIQSGDDKILRKMNRKITSAYILRLVGKIKEAVPRVAITTDIMVGFPGERANNFDNTVELIKKIKPLKVHVFPFSARPGTKAFDFSETVSHCDIQDRISRINKVAEECSQAYKDRFLGKSLPVLVEDRLSDGKSWRGYTDNYIDVMFKSGKKIHNRLVIVELKKLFGEQVLGRYKSEYA